MMKMDDRSTEIEPEMDPSSPDENDDAMGECDSSAVFLLCELVLF